MLRGALIIGSSLGLPLQNIRRRGLSIAAASPSMELPAPTLFVDSVGGDDGNDGRSAASALQTLGAALAVAGDNEVFGLAHGSYWAEVFNVSALDATTVVAYGDAELAPPEINGLEAVEPGGWSATGGYPNVYEAAITWDDSGGRLRAYRVTAVAPDYTPVYTQLTGVDDLAACEATSNSFVRVYAGAGSPTTLYVNYNNGGDPNSIPDGQIAFTARVFGVVAGNDTTIVGPLVTGFAISNDGSFTSADRQGQLVKRMWCRHGSKHNAVIGAGVMEDCLGSYADTVVASDPSNVTFTFYKNAAAGFGGIARRCGIFGITPGAAWGAHGNLSPFDSFERVQCWAVNNSQGGVGAASSIVGEFMRGCGEIPVSAGNVSQSIFHLPSLNAGGGGPGTYSDTLVTDCCFLVEQKLDSSNEIFRPGSYEAAFQNCALYVNTSLTTGANSVIVANGPTNQKLSHHLCVFFNGHTPVRMPAANTYTGDYNVFLAGEPGETRPVSFSHYSAGWILTLADWQAASGQDANSCYLARVDQARGNAYAFWLGVAQDENDGPVDEDWRVNPNARVYSGANVAFVGTFPDGVTPITAAGPQNQWNWNTRASVAGQVTRHPDVPDSDADAVVYLKNPKAWNFYP